MKRDSPADPVAAVTLLAEPTRRRLYEFVIAREVVGRDAAAAALGISRELAAFHLDRLVAGGLLETSFRRLTGRSGPGAGRPAKLYSKSHREASFSLPVRRYDLVADVFATGLERLAEDVGDETVSEAVQAPARDRGLAAGAEVRRLAGRGSSTKRRREALLTHLDQHGFEPTTDSSTGAITLSNCPYRTTANAHRDLTCGMNLAWAQGIVEAAGDVGVIPRLDIQPGRCCVVFGPGS